ncbi:MAG: sulfite exporter TauE/SafE family protein [Sideroxydans sp.]
MIDINMVVSVPMAATLGFAYGMGPCLISCAPFLAPVFLASEGGMKQSWRILLPLSLGRLVAYSSLGGVAGAVGYHIKGIATGSALHLLLGSAVLLMGGALLLRKAGMACKIGTTGEQHTLRRMALPVHRTAMPGGLFLMGVAMTLSPCAPLGLVLFSAAMSGGTMSGMLLGLCFGLGAIVVPSVVFGVGMAYVGASLREQLKDWLPRIERLSAWLLVLTGVGSLARW